MTFWIIAPRVVKALDLFYGNALFPGGPSYRGVRTSAVSSPLALWPKSGPPSTKVTLAVFPSYVGTVALPIDFYFAEYTPLTFITVKSSLFSSYFPSGKESRGV